MKFIIIILSIIIIILTSYLFLIIKELKRIKHQIISSRNTNSNGLIHSSLQSKYIKELIKEINNLLVDNRKEKILYERKNIKLKKMIRNISHDLKTPLTSALGYINILNNSNKFNNDSKKELKIIESRINRLDELIKSFFNFSKTISSNKVEKESINIISILEEAIAGYYDDYNSKDRKIVFNASVRKYNINTNYDMMIRIFDNLISNSYIHSVGELEINLTVKNSVTITFTNSLVNKDLDVGHIFDEFYTYDISRTKGNTGLGLCIVKEFTEKLGGEIKAIKKDDKLSIILEFI